MQPVMDDGRPGQLEALHRPLSFASHSGEANATLEAKSAFGSSMPLSAFPRMNPYAVRFPRQVRFPSPLSIWYIRIC